MSNLKHDVSKYSPPPSSESPPPYAFLEQIDHGIDGAGHVSEANWITFITSILLWPFRLMYAFVLAGLNDLYAFLSAVLKETLSCISTNLLSISLIQWVILLIALLILVIVGLVYLLIRPV